jgi:hypothetical protein
MVVKRIYRIEHNWNGGRLKPCHENGGHAVVVPQDPIGEKSVEAREYAVEVVCTARDSIIEMRL